MSLTLSIAEMERARLARDPAYNGLFVLGVKTTGIFCRPTCTARPPLAKNVVYFADPAEAIAAGFRACKRCRPTALEDEPRWAAELRAELSRTSSARITEQDLSARGLDPATVRRHFQRNFGMTFQAFARARRLNDARAELQTGAAVEDATFASGYESESGFRDAFAKLFGAAPAAARDRDAIQLAWFPSPLGPLVAGTSNKGLCFLEFSDPARLQTQLTSLRGQFAAPVAPGTNETLE